MLLETLDIKKDDIVIFSQNLYNLDNNFRIVYKDDDIKESREISFTEVCRFVNEYTPKNLIIYRLLTNIQNFEISVPKYGVFLNINGIAEMIFFDPVYAVRELEESPQSIDYKGLRFRIQQVGLTTLNRKNGLPNYAEIYSIDLEATEAKFLNDKAFADAIFSTYDSLKPGRKNSNSFGNPPAGNPVNKNVNSVETIINPHMFNRKIFKDISDNKSRILPGKELKQDNNIIITTAETGQNIGGTRIVNHNISEDKNFDYKEITKINIRDSALSEDNKPGKGFISKKRIIPVENESKISSPKMQQAEKKDQSLFGKYLKDSQSNSSDKKVIRQPGDEKISQVLDMFKSSTSLNEYVKNRVGKQIVLKLDKK
jgi:hypothetical protein